MRNLLAALLILALAGSARAALSMEVNGLAASGCDSAPLVVDLSEPVTVTIYSSTDAHHYGIYLQLTPREETEWLLPPTFTPAAGRDASFEDFSDEDFSGSGYPGRWIELEAKSFQPWDPPMAGKHFEVQFQLTVSVPDELPICVRMWDFNTEHILAGAAIVPEPATLATLVLGALMLARRRRR